MDVDINYAMLKGFQFTFNYDPEILQYQSYLQESVLGLPSELLWINPNVGEPGRIGYLAAARKGDDAVETSGTLVTLKFLALNEGTTDILVSDILLVDETNSSMNAAVSDGYVCVGNCGVDLTGMVTITMDVIRTLI
jgi:hypothetical protein